MLNLQWVRKFSNGQWIDLHTVDLAKVEDFGVYIIWHGGQPSRTVRVGQGDIADRLADHREDPKVQAYRKHGLYVMWAAVSEVLVDGVERYLAEQYQPLVGVRWPDAQPIEVSSPYAA